MGIFNNLFGKTSEEKSTKKSNINWFSLTSLEQLEEIKEQSKLEPVVIFKHSTRCGISRMVLKQFENSFDESLKDLKVYYLDLLSFRDISNKIAEEFQVLHQSPQLILIKNEEVIAHYSHYDITQVNLSNI